MPSRFALALAFLLPILLVSPGHAKEDPPVALTPEQIEKIRQDLGLINLYAGKAGGSDGKGGAWTDGAWLRLLVDEGKIRQIGCLVSGNSGLVQIVLTTPGAAKDLHGADPDARVAHVLPIRLPAKLEDQKMYPALDGAFGSIRNPHAEVLYRDTQGYSLEDFYGPGKAAPGPALADRTVIVLLRSPQDETACLRDLRRAVPEARVLRYQVDLAGERKLDAKDAVKIREALERAGAGVWDEAKPTKEGALRVLVRYGTLLPGGILVAAESAGLSLKVVAAGFEP